MERGGGVQALEMPEVGAGAASAGIVGVESMACARVVHTDGWEGRVRQVGPTDQRERVGERAVSTDVRGPW
jgi:hypothetical protein